MINDILYLQFVHCNSLSCWLGRSTMKHSMRKAGRVAQLCTLPLNPELNGKFVVMTSYAPETGLYTVQTLATPDKSDTISTILVGHNNLARCTPDLFSSEYPSHPAAGLHDLKESLSRQITFDTPIYVRGKEVPFENVDNLAPQTVLSGRLQINPLDENSPMIFEDIHFAQTGGESNVICFAGKQIIFRRCRFTGKEFGLCVGHKLNGAVMKVVCESCLFENSEYAGILITSTSQLTLLNCKVRNSRVGIDAQTGGTIKMTHTTISGTVEYAARVDNKTGRIVATNCTINDNKEDGLLVTSGSSALIRGCYFHGCLGRAIGVNGPKSTTVHIEDTLITECATGVYICSGKVKVSAVNVEVTKSTMIGFFVTFFATGDVAVTNCRFHNNVVDFDNSPKQACTVTVDGAVYHERSDAARILYPEMFTMSMADKYKTNCELQQVMRERGTLPQQRVLKKIIGLQIKCANCSNVEGADDKFRSCSRCKHVGYCSKDCQLAHWEEHKKTCGLPHPGW